MKILYYNWIQFDNKDNIGGGVNIYQRNLIDYLVNNTNYEIYFLSSGWKYNPFKRKTYIRPTNNIYKGRCKSFELINSTIMAPAFAIFMNPDRFIHDIGSENILDKFIQDNGPFDVIHFNNIEGISINVLKLKEKYPNTKFIVSIHNYQPICPLVQYFQNHNKCICNDYKNGEECLRCSQWLPNLKEYTKRCKNFAYDILNEYHLKFLKPLAKLYTLLFYYRSKSYIGNKSTMLPANYVEYRKHNIEYLNKYADYVLAVSERVREIMIKNGCNPDIVKTSYIGTKFAENELKYSVAQNTQPFTIAYLGYERIDKGFFFFIDALNKMNSKLASKINVVLAVAGIHKENYENKLSHFNKVIVYNGYTHDKLQDILKEVNLGIVPVLWEDNLPQVAIEMVALGVPILCSDFGGASELTKSDLFKFKGGDESDFINKLQGLVNYPDKLNEYWEYHPPLTTMKKHIEELTVYYGGDNSWNRKLA